MKLFFVTILSTIAGAALLLSPERSVADKMQPGHMSHTTVHGLNANTDCRRPRFNICQGCNVDIRMRVAQGRSCGFNFQSLGPFSGQEVTVPPRNGTFSSSNQTTSIYRPNSGYVGQDHFETRLYFEEGNGKRTFLTLKVNVFVVPNL